MQTENRRSFLKKTGTVLAAGSFLNLSPSADGANEKIVLALIGGNNQGRGDARSAIRDVPGFFVALTARPVMPFRR